MQHIIKLSLAAGVIAVAGLGGVTQGLAKAHGNGVNPGSFINDENGTNTAKTTARGGTLGGLVGNGSPNGGNSDNAPGASQGQDGPNGSNAR